MGEDVWREEREYACFEGVEKNRTVLIGHSCVRDAVMFRM